jgi:hypothetical protein
MVCQDWMELKRMAISDDAPKNTASRMISYMVRDIRKDFPSVPRLISYQDPAVHSGTIYRASGWQCTGARKSGGFASAKVRYREADQAPGDKIRWELELRAPANIKEESRTSANSGRDAMPLDIFEGVQ